MFSMFFHKILSAIIPDDVRRSTFDGSKESDRGEHRTESRGENSVNIEESEF